MAFLADYQGFLGQPARSFASGRPFTLRKAYGVHFWDKTPCQALRQRCGRARSDDEAGFTLIELIVAIGVLAVGIFATMQVYFGAMNVSVATTSRQATAKFANEELERLQVVPWSGMGFQPSAGAPPVVDGEPTVILTSGQLTPGPDTVTRGALTLEVTRSVTERNDPGGATYRHVRVTVVNRTPGPGRDVSVTSESARYEGSGFATSADDPASPTLPSAPTSVSLTPPVDADPATVVDVSWTPGVGDVQYYEVAVNTTGTRWYPYASRMPATTTSMRLIGLAPGITYQIGVRATNGTRTSVVASATYTMATATTAPPPNCFVTFAGVTPGENALLPPNKLTSDIRAEVVSGGTCGALGMRAMSDSGPVWGTMTATDQLYRGVIGRMSGEWSPGARTVDIVELSTDTVLASMTMVVVG